MCFGKPKVSKPKMQDPMAAIKNTPPPIAEQTPAVQSGADVADAERSRKKRSVGNALSLFQINLTPGATSIGDEEPGASSSGEV